MFDILIDIFDGADFSYIYVYMRFIENVKGRTFL